MRAGSRPDARPVHLPQLKKGPGSLPLPTPPGAARGFGHIGHDVVPFRARPLPVQSGAGKVNRQLLLLSQPLYRASCKPLQCRPSRHLQHTAMLRRSSAHEECLAAILRSGPFRVTWPLRAAVRRRRRTGYGRERTGASQIAKLCPHPELAEGRRKNAPDADAVKSGRQFDFAQAYRIARPLSMASAPMRHSQEQRMRQQRYPKLLQGRE